MEIFLLYLLLLALVVYAIVWMRSSGPVGLESPDLDVTPVSDAPASVYARHRDLLEERWRMAGVSAHATRELDLPPWYYDDADDWQIDRIERAGVPLDAEALTHGQANDFIGLRVPPGDDETEVLHGLGEPVAGLSLTAARHRLARLLSNPEYQRRWELLAATPIQREFFRLAGEPVPPGLTAGEARRLIADRVVRDDAVSRDWWRFLQLYDDVNVRRADFRLRQIPAALLGDAVALLRDRKGRTLAQLLRNLDLVVDKLVDLDPDLEIE
jgi:hypothetical protein